MSFELKKLIPILYEAAYNRRSKPDELNIAMSRPFEIEITESEAELKKRLQTARGGNQKEKLQMLWWIKSGQVKEPPQGAQQQEIGKRLGLNTSTVTRWLQKYRKSGLAELLRIKKAPGAQPKIPAAAMAGLRQKLENEVGFKSYGEIVEWLKKAYELDVKYGTVYGLVRGKLGAKLKVPRPQSYQQQPESVSKFKKNSVSC